MRHAAAVRMKNVAKERLIASGIVNGASAAEEVAVAIAGAVDVVTRVVLTEVDETLIDVVHEDQDHLRLDVETQEIEDHFEVLHRREILIPTFQVIEVIGEEMNHAVDHLQRLCRQDTRFPDHAHLLGVGAAQIQHLFRHNRDAGPRRLTEFAEATVAEVVELEEGAQTVVIVGDHTRLLIAPDLGLRRLASEEEALQSPLAHLLHQGRGTAAEEIHRRHLGRHHLQATARAKEWPRDGNENRSRQARITGTL